MGSKQSNETELLREEKKLIQPAVEGEEESEKIDDAVSRNATVQIITRNVNLSQSRATPQREQTPQRERTTTRLQTTFKILEFIFWIMSSLLGMFGGGFTIYSLTMQHLYPNPPEIQPINNYDP